MRRSLVLGSLLIAWAAACGASEDSRFKDGQRNSGDPGSSGGFDTGGSSGTSSSGATAPSTLKIDPPSVVVTATGGIGALTGGTTFKALLDDSPNPVAAKWTIDDAGIGTIDGAGNFKVGLFAGKTTVRAQVGNLQATAEVIVDVKIEEDLTSLTPAEKTALRTGGTADPAFKWLYPYDRTVFPRGLPSPRLQLSGAAPTAFYVRAKSQHVEYEGFYPGGTGGAARVTLAQDLWRVLTQSAKAGDPITVQVSKLAGAAVTGPIAETWHVAQGSLKGTVFYNSYNSSLAGTQTGSSGAVMRVKPGSPVEVLIGTTTVNGTQAGCVVCHSVSAQGTRLVAGVDWSDDNPIDSASFGISATGAATQEYTSPEGRLLPFGALSPDSKYLVGSGVSTSGPNLRGLAGDFPSKLYDAATGAVISDAYFGGATKRYALTPAFSPGGKLLAFTDKAANDDGRVLGLLSFDASVNPPAFSNYQTLVTSPNKIVAWPTFTADGKAVVFHEGDHFDTGQHADGDTLGPRYADLKWVDVATKTVAALDALNGFRKNAGGVLETYLPYGEAEDAHLNYEPTILPVAVGGYYWVVFTSRRSFGNTIYSGPNSLRSVGDRAFDNGNAIGRGYRKKLWIAAIDINGAPGTDISHPAFYLEGQEGEAGNMRGFWALDPCKSDNSSCESGDDCCGGFCRQVDQGGTLVEMCVLPPSGCSNDSEKCAVDADCCNAPTGTKCIGGFCNQPAPK